jgi:hypothetical protein
MPSYKHGKVFWFVRLIKDLSEFCIYFNSSKDNICPDEHLIKTLKNKSYLTIKIRCAGSKLRSQLGFA